MFVLSDDDPLIRFSHHVLCSMVPGNLDWVGNEFTFNTGAGLVISQPEGVDDRNSTVVKQLRDAFERDWFSSYARSLQPDTLPVCNRRQASRLVPLRSAHPRLGSTVLSAGSPRRQLTAAIKTTPHDNNECHYSNQLEPSRGSSGHLDNELASTKGGYVEEGVATVTQPGDRQVHGKGSHSDCPMGFLLPRQPIESSGGQELQSEPLWPHGIDV